MTYKINRICWYCGTKFITTCSSELCPACGMFTLRKVKAQIMRMICYNNNWIATEKIIQWIGFINLSCSAINLHIRDLLKKGYIVRSNRMINKKNCYGIGLSPNMIKEISKCKRRLKNAD